jgi:hypothetical protein
MPGEQPGENGQQQPIPPGKISVGRVIDGIEFQQFADAGLVRPLGIDIASAQGDKFTLMIVSGLGLALGSFQTKRVFIIEVKALVDLALLLGIDRDRPAIVVPGSGVRRG